jgi:hypothetical protein
MPSDLAEAKDLIVRALRIADSLSLEVAQATSERSKGSEAHRAVHYHAYDQRLAWHYLLDAIEDGRIVLAESGGIKDSARWASIPVPMSGSWSRHYCGEAGSFCDSDCHNHRHETFPDGSVRCIEVNACDLCEKGFPVEAGQHYGTQALGMIPTTPCTSKEAGKHG